MNLLKLDAMREEINYMIENNIIEPRNSDFSSPSMLVSKADGTYRFVTNFKAVNAIRKCDSYPIPRIEDCIDKIGRAKYVSTFDLLKGFWHVPLTDRANDCPHSPHQMVCINIVLCHSVCEIARQHFIALYIGLFPV